MRLLVVLILCLVLSVAFAGKSKRKERVRTKRIDREDALPDVVEEGGEDEDVEIEQPSTDPVSSNPCNNVKCNRGEICVLDEGEAQCICRGPCPDGDGAYYQVCSTRNQTYATECHLDRDNCLCKLGQPGCSEPGAHKIRLDYFGPCKQMTECPDEEFADFPQRMRDWFLVIMKELANRRELDEYLDQLESAKHDDKHTDAVIWKFCDLDVHPRDRSVTRRELLYVVASLKPMEHCLLPFLNMCDENNDNNINLIEWGTCLGIKQETIRDNTMCNK